MKAKGIAEGERLIALEARLESHFADRSVTDKILRGLLARIAESLRTLRYAHLATHLETPKILSDVQIVRYNELRGYGGAAHGAGHSGH